MIQSFHPGKVLVLAALLFFIPSLPMIASTIDPDTVPVLISRLGEPRLPLVPATASYKLSRRLTLPTIELLLAEIRKKKGPVRDECFSLLDRAKDPHLVDLLLPLLQEKDLHCINKCLRYCPNKMIRA